MLIKFSGTKPFIFLANTKVASTSIEYCDQIASVCDIRVRHTRFGKHWPLPVILKRYAHIFEMRDIRDFTVAAVVREPIDWFQSWYNYRQMPQNRSSTKTSFGLTPEEFFHDIFQHENIDQISISPHHPLRLIRYGEHLENDLLAFCFDVGLDRPDLPRKNISTKTGITIGPDLQAELEVRFKADFDMWRQANALNLD